ncbi:MAG TPA: trehalose-6-phosphate synthase [Dehalococcoidia bacterium]|nr:trehalose-6-phosphate synthase [Dehalococcoidia bacterium]
MGDQDVQGLLARKLARLEELCRRVLDSRRLIVASNRGPIEFVRRTDGSLQPRRGSGGLVTALLSAARFVPVTWVAAAMDDKDREAAQAHSGVIELEDMNMRLRLVVVPERTYHRYYYVFANPLLWFVQHYMWNAPWSPIIGRAVHQAWDAGYVPVNRAFARAIAEEASQQGGAPLVIVHDYHLYLVPAEVKSLLPEATVLHFTHIPWPAPRYWGLLPRHMRQAIHASLCAADIVGMQTRSDARNFLYACEHILPDAAVDHQHFTITYEGHTTYVAHYPVSVDVQGLSELAESAEVERYRQRLAPLLADCTVVRVDRAEPSKNIVRSLRAWEEFLWRYPDFQRRSVLLQFLVPSRTELDVYRNYVDEVFQLTDEINDRFGDEEWQPVHVFYEHNYPQAIAALSLYDVLFVSPIIDGMNLVAKEGPLVNRRDGVLVLSEMAGAHEQLREAAISVCPTDMEGMVQALYQACTMPRQERRQRADALRRLVQEEDILHWLEAQLRDLWAVSQGQRP